MNMEEFKSLDGVSKASVRLVGANMLNLTPRTLLYGYTYERNTCHVYLDGDHVIHQVFYSYGDVMISHGTEERLRPEDYPPDKRLYPETCDLEFCQNLRSQGIYLPFTYFNIDRPISLWYGKRFEELG